MPGFLYHLACSERVLQEFPSLQSKEARTAFLLGNIIPDLTKNKDESHFRHIHTSGWKTPNLTVAKRKILSRPTPLLLGCYCHLFLDHYFITTHLAQRSVLAFGGRVIDFAHDRIYDADVFLSDRGLYGSYSAGNALLVKENLLPKGFMSLPDKPPLTGMAVFDDRKDVSWHERIKKYLSMLDDDDMEIDIFTPEELRDVALVGALHFMDDIRYLRN